MPAPTTPLPPVPNQTQGLTLASIQNCVQLWAAKWAAVSSTPLPPGAQYLPYPAVPNQTEGSTLTSIQNLMIATFDPLGVPIPDGGLYAPFPPGNYQPNNVLLTSIQRLLIAWLVVGEGEHPAGAQYRPYPAVPNQTEGAILTSIQNILATLLPIVAPAFLVPNDPMYQPMTVGNYLPNNRILTSIQNLWSAVALYSL